MSTAANLSSPRIAPPYQKEDSAISDLAALMRRLSSMVHWPASGCSWLVSVTLKLHWCLVFQRLQGLGHTHTQRFNREFK